MVLLLDQSEPEPQASEDPPEAVHNPEIAKRRREPTRAGQNSEKETGVARKASKAKKAA